MLLEVKVLRVRILQIELRSQFICPTSLRMRSEWNGARLGRHHTHSINNQPHQETESQRWLQTALSTDCSFGVEGSPPSSPCPRCWPLGWSRPQKGHPLLRLSLRTVKAERLGESFRAWCEQQTRSPNSEHDERSHETQCEHARNPFSERAERAAASFSDSANGKQERCDFMLGKKKKKKKPCCANRRVPHRVVLFCFGPP